MKTIILFLSFLLSISTISFSQGFSVEHLSHKNLLYIGFDNHLNFHQIGCKYDNYEIASENCMVSKLADAKDSDTYIVKAKREALGNTAKIYFIVNEQKVDSALFEVQVLPVPQLHWGNRPSGSTFSTSNQIKISYATGVVIKSSFEIVSWECEVKDETLKGEDALLSDEVLELSRSLAASDRLTITVNYKGPDGTTRKMNGSWVKR